MEAWGDRVRIGVVPVGEARADYYLVMSAPARAAHPPWPVLRSAFDGFDGVAAEVLAELARPPEVHHDLVELDRPIWGRPRVLLLGDAAHAMTPNQGQGAAMAIEDAIELVRALRPGPDGALERYQAARDRRVRTVQLNSRRIGAVAHWRDPTAIRIRNAAIRATPGWVSRQALRVLVQPGVDLAAASAQAD